MYLIKTTEGQQAFKERHADLSQRLRSAFLLFDGNRSLSQVLEATSALGISKDDILALISRGWLAGKDGGQCLQPHKHLNFSCQPWSLPKWMKKACPVVTRRLIPWQSALPVDWA